jgi:hypothetical protein
MVRSPAVVESELGSEISPPGDVIDEPTPLSEPGWWLGDPGLRGDATMPTAASTR